MAELLSLAAAVVTTLAGIGLSYFGYEIAQKVLALAGTVAGFAGGLAVGGVVYPSVTGSDQVVALTFFLGLVGAILGRIFVPALSQLAFALAGFVMTSLAAVTVISQGQVVDILLAAFPDSLAEANPVAVLERIAAAPLFTDPAFEQTLLIAVVAGLVGAAIALQFYDEFVAVATTAVGAAMLGMAIPVLIVVYEGGVASSSAADFSVLWAAVVFVTGSAFELYRNREEMTVI